MNTQGKIKDISFSDYRSHIPGVVCRIYDCLQLSGFCAVLKVLPVDYLDTTTNDTTSTVTGNEDSINTGSNFPAGNVPRYFNVIYSTAAGIFGFVPKIKEIYFAYVMTDEPTKLEGCPAILIPQTFLRSAVHKSDISNIIEPDIVSKDDLDQLTMRKENLIQSRMFK